MEALSTMDILYTDKTGTLTYGEFKVDEYSAPDDVLKEVIYMEQQSSHPIARAIVTAFKETDLSSVDHNEPVSEIAGSGIKKGTVRVGKPSAFSTFKNYDRFKQYFQKATRSFSQQKKRRSLVTFHSVTRFADSRQMPWLTSRKKALKSRY